MSAASSFEQIVTIWSLATSDKGKHLRKVFKESSEQLIGAITQNLQSPHEEKVDLDGGGYAIRALDVRPEVRLRTMVSVADDTRSMPALATVITYTQSTIDFWAKSRPDYSASVSVLHALDMAEWNQIGALDLHQQIRAALLSNLKEKAGSRDIEALVGYIEGKKSRWIAKEQQELVTVFEYYLQNTFDNELADSSTENELTELSETLRGIANWCKIDISEYESQIDDSIADLSQSEEDDGHTPDRWEGAHQPITERMQEAEVKRLFDGLR